MRGVGAGGGGLGGGSQLCLPLDTRAQVRAWAQLQPHQAPTQGGEGLAEAPQEIRGPVMNHRPWGLRLCTSYRAGRVQGASLQPRSGRGEGPDSLGPGPAGGPAVSGACAE